MKETVSVQIPIWHSRLLKRWAYVKSRPRSTMATDIIQARVEANEDQIMRMYQEVADIRGISVADLDAEIGVSEDKDAGS